MYYFATNAYSKVQQNVHYLRWTSSLSLLRLRAQRWYSSIAGFCSDKMRIFHHHGPAWETSAKPGIIE